MFDATPANGSLRARLRVYLDVIRRILVAVLVIVGLVIAAFIAAVIVVRFPPIPRMVGIEAFGLISWVEPIGNLAMLLVVVVCGLRLVMRRDATSWLAVFLPLLLSILTALLYLPFLGAVDHRLDRIAGPVFEPIPEGRALAVSVAVTLILANAFVVTARGRTVDPAAGHVARTVVLTLCTILPSIHIFFLIMPMLGGWWPAERQRRDLLVAFRPCRGALLWHDAEYPRAMVRIDDIWTRFADPRRNGERVWAISGSGEFYEGYFWLDREEVGGLKVREDDPAVLRCDSRARTENVDPAPWHKMGLE